MSAAPGRPKQARAPSGGSEPRAAGSVGAPVSVQVLFSPEADEDLARLFGFLLDRAESLEDLDHADAAMQAIRSAALDRLATTPYIFRKVGTSPTRREPIIPSGATGYVALNEIASAARVVVLAVRHQREEDYH
jgi:plasmid stabilization system protein ParE